MSRELHDERISAYLDGELSAGERAEMEELLKTSSSHQQVLAELISLRESFQSLPHYTLGNDFAARVTVAALKAAEDARGATRDTRPMPAAVRSGSAMQKWLLAAVGGIAVTAASVALVVYNWNGKDNNIVVVKPPVINEPVVSEFVRAVSSTKDNEAVVVRVKLTKDAIRGKFLDNALAAHGIQMATADANNEAARQTGLAYKEMVKSQVGAAVAPGAADVVFLEANVAQLEQALGELANNPAAKATFAPESLVASIGQGPMARERPEGEPGSVGTQSKIPSGGYYQHMPPRGFTLTPAPTAPALQPGAKVPVKKSARVLIVVEVVD